MTPQKPVWDNYMVSADCTEPAFKPWALMVPATSATDAIAHAREQLDDSRTFELRVVVR